MSGPVKATCHEAETLPKDKTPHFVSTLAFKSFSELPYLSLMCCVAAQVLPAAALISVSALLLLGTDWQSCARSVRSGGAAEGRRLLPTVKTCIMLPGNSQ